MENKDLQLTESFVKTAFNEGRNVLTSVSEVALDAVLNNGVLKDIPFVSTVVSFAKFGSEIKKAHEIKKLNEFLLTIQNENADEEKRKKRKKKLCENKKFCEKELEYLLIILDRYVDYDKSNLLARLYIALLDEKINWSEFTCYAVIIDSLFISDIKILQTKSNTFSFHCSDDRSFILRLTALGLVQDDTFTLPFTNGELGEGRKESKYKINSFGLKFLSIILPDENKPQFVKEYEDYKKQKENKNKG